MSDDKLVITKDEASLLKMELESVCYKTGYEFLAQHNGFRPCKMHMVLGLPGAGKSTLIRSIVIDFLRNNPKKNLYIWLSEETVSEFKTGMLSHLDLIGSSSNVFVTSEQGMDKVTSTIFFEWLVEQSNLYGEGLFLFDNVTTSEVYNDKKPIEQTAFLKDMKKCTQELGFSTLLVAHTGKSVNPNMLIDSNDVRGSSSIANLCEFIYVLQMFISSGVKTQTLTLEKNRAYDTSCNRFILQYDRCERIYSVDVPLTIEYLRDLSKKRDRI